MTTPPRKKIVLGKPFSESQVRAVTEATLRAVGYKESEPLPSSPPEPGDLIAGKGIYVGEYSPVDRYGVSLGKIFNVFAAPEDLPERMGYDETLEYIAHLKSWHGHDGTNYPTDKEIYAALKDGSYNGGWIMPTRDILDGKDIDGKETTPDNIHAHKGKGALKGAFKITGDRSSGLPGWYWSSTQDRVASSFVWEVRLLDGSGAWGSKLSCPLSCRPVRLVPI